MRWSLTKLKMSEQCLRKYKYRYIEGRKEAKTEQAERGIDNHKLVELFIKGEPVDLPGQLEFYRTFFGTLRDHPSKFAEHQVALREDLSPCTWDDPGAWYTGVLDLKLLDSPTVAYNYDWKTGKVYPDHDEGKEIYALATFAEHPEVQEVRSFYVYLDLNQTRSRTFFRSQVSDLWQGWRNRVQTLEATTEFIEEPGFHCRWCAFSKSKGGPCRF